jgi:predicted O-methyltransferase YrrM
MKFHSDSIQGWFTWQNIYSEAVNHFDDGSNFVEIGVWLGKSAIYLAECIKMSSQEQRLYAIDPWNVDCSGIKIADPPFNGSAYPQFMENVEIANVEQVIRAIPLRSNDALIHFPKRDLSMVWIDANHDYESVSQDIKNWLTKIVPGGWIGGHDYLTCPQTKQAVDEAFGSRVIVDNESWVVKDL